MVSLANGVSNTINTPCQIKRTDHCFAIRAETNRRMIMDLVELEECLSDFLPSGFKITRDADDCLVVYTGLKENKFGDLITLEVEEVDFDPDLDQLDEDDYDF